MTGKVESFIVLRWRMNVNDLKEIGKLIMKEDSWRFSIV